MKYIKDIIHWFSNIFGILYFFLRQIRYGDFRCHITYERQERPLAILANGPSLKMVLDDRRPLEQCDLCCVNYFAVSEVFLSLRPYIYVLADPEFWLDSPDYEQKRAPLFDVFMNKVDWPMELYVPFVTKKSVDIERLFSPNPNITIRYYHTSNWPSFPSMRHWAYRKGWAMPAPQNVTIACIYIGINKGYRLIDLYGVDHSWTEQLTVNSHNEVCLVDRHFCDQDSEPQPWLDLYLQPYRMHQILRDLAQMFDSYHFLRSYGDSRGVTIVNHSKNSFIDAFERAND